MVGAWRLVSCEHEAADGAVWRPFGPKPLGRLVYTGDGRMLVMLMDPDRPRAASRQLFEAKDAELAAAARGCVAYGGSWKARGGVVTHEVEMSLFPNWIGTEQVRAFAVKGRRVSFSTRPFAIRGVVQTARLVWEREI